MEDTPTTNLGTQTGEALKKAAWHAKYKGGRSTVAIPAESEIGVVALKLNTGLATLAEIKAGLKAVVGIQVVKVLFYDTIGPASEVPADSGIYLSTRVTPVVVQNPVALPE